MREKFIFGISTIKLFHIITSNPNRIIYAITTQSGGNPPNPHADQSNNDIYAYHASNDYPHDHSPIRCNRRKINGHRRNHRDNLSILAIS